MNIIEIFHSIQGEGILSGVASVFVRLAGCHLRCRWCDTPYALKATDGQVMSIAEVVAQVEKWACRHVVVTGGEPLLTGELPPLLEALHQRGRHITLETSATQYRPVTCDLVSISPKLAHSQTDASLPRLNIAAIGEFVARHEVQLKFVVESRADLQEIEGILSQLPPVPRDKVLLMPQARTRAEHTARGPQVVTWCLEHGFRYCPRLHVELWDGQRGC